MLALRLCTDPSGYASQLPRRGLRMGVAMHYRQLVGIQIGGGIQCRSLHENVCGG